MVGEQGGPTSQGTPRLAAYAYFKTKDPAFAQRAIRATALRAAQGALAPQHIVGPEVLNPVDEAPGISSNGAAQNSLTDIEILELCADQLPDEMPVLPEGTTGGGRGGPGRGERDQPVNAPAVPTDKSTRTGYPCLQ